MQNHRPDAASQPLPRSRERCRARILDLIAEPGEHPIMRELPSGAWVHVYRDGRRAGYILLDHYRNGSRLPGYRKVRLRAHHRVHITPRHELIPCDFDGQDENAMFALLDEMEADGQLVLVWVSSYRTGVAHYHVLVGTTSADRKSYWEARIVERFGEVLKPNKLACPGYGYKIFESGGYWYLNKSHGWCVRPLYDTRARDWMLEQQDNKLEFLHRVLRFLRAVPRWELPDSVTPTPPAPPVTPSWAPVVVAAAPPAAAAEALPTALIGLLNKDVPAPKKQAYDAYEPDEAARNGWAIMCVSRQLGLTAERLWQERHRPGMKHFRSRRRLEREYARVDATSTRGGDRRLAWAIAAQDDPNLSVLAKRFVLHIAIRNGLVFGYRNLADAIGCSPMQIVYLTRDTQVLKYVEKTGKIIRPNQGREAQTFGIVEPPQTVDLPTTLHSGTFRGICSKMAELRMAKLRWWDHLPSGETVLDAVTRLGGVQELAKEKQLAVWRLRVEDQQRTLARQEAQAWYYKHLDDKKAARESRRWRRQMEWEIAFHKDPQRVDDSIMDRFRPAA